MQKILNYNEFKEVIRKRIQKRFDDDTEIKINKVLKNNSQELDSLVILRPGYSVSPNFYLKFYYENYIKGENLQSIVDSIIRKYNESNNDIGRMNLDMSYSNCCDRITFRLVSKEKNTGLLESIPYIPFLDMVIIFYCVVVIDDGGIASVRVSNYMMDEWEIDIKQLFCLAKINTIKLFPKKLYSLESMIRNMLYRDGDDKELDDYFESDKSFIREMTPLVVTNSNGINGASVILYPDTLKEVSEVLGGDFYILPSSIHEVLAIRDTGEFQSKELENMVKEVNESCVLPEEVLSDHVYHYSEGLDRIEIVNVS